MAMLITKFHKLIQSRVIWGIILAVIVISFVGLYVRWPGQRDVREAQSPGSLNGQPVSASEFRQAYLDSFLNLALKTGRAPELNQRKRAQLEKVAWRRLVNQRLADELNLKPGDREIVAEIQHNFSAQGQYNPGYYNSFVGNFLAPLGVSGLAFEDYVSRELELNAIRNMVSSLVLISPGEVNRTLHAITDTFEAEYVRLPVLESDGEQVGEKEARAYYEDHLEEFRVGDQVRTRYVRFPVESYLDQVELDPEEALTYYDEHLDEFTVEPKAELNATNEVPDVVEETQPFEEVQDLITAKLTHQEALNLAMDAATEMVISLTPGRRQQAPTFDEAAATYGRDIVELRPITQHQPIDEIDAGLEYNRAAFDLDLNRDLYFSDAVAGESNVYVIALTEKIESHIPEFEEVSEAAMEAAKVEARTSALSERANQLRTDAQEALAAGKTFKEAVVPYDVEVQELGEFTSSTGIEGLEEGEGGIIHAAILSNPGDVSEPIASGDGVILLHMIKRTPSDLTGLTELRQEVIDGLKRQRSNQVWADWEEYLMELNKFELRSNESADEDKDETQ